VILKIPFRLYQPELVCSNFGYGSVSLSQNYVIFGRTMGGIFKGCPLHVISEGLEEMFEGDFTDTCAKKFPLVLIGGQAVCCTCTDMGASPNQCQRNLVLALELELSLAILAIVSPLILKPDKMTDQLQIILQRGCVSRWSLSLRCVGTVSNTYCSQH
jgi:hypothetical protein